MTLHRRTWSVGQRVTLTGHIIRALDEDASSKVVAIDIGGWPLPVTLPVTMIQRRDPLPDIIRKEPVSVQGTITRIGPGAFGPQTITVRLEGGHMAQVQEGNLTGAN
jgi:tartrate dehydratase beta subunit/fumarate hydratase class I family protein